MKYPCDVCSIKDCPSAYVCPELKEWIKQNRKKIDMCSERMIAKDIFVTNDDD